jgi:hypothetical protein
MVGEGVGDVLQIFVGSGEVKGLLQTIKIVKLADESIPVIKIIEEGAEASGIAEDAAKAGVSEAPSFIVSEGGTVFPVPKGATGPIPATSGKGFQFIEGAGGNGLNPKVTGFRLMDPVTTGKYQYPGGYGSYFNKVGQTINPLTGQTIAPSNPWWHIPAK